MLLLQAGLKIQLYFILDMFWPVSNIWMLATGITVITANRLHGWMRYIPLVAGLWLPLHLVGLGFGLTREVMLIGGLYSAIAWTLLGLVVLRLDAKQSFLKPHIA